MAEQRCRSAYSSECYDVGSALSVHEVKHVMSMKGLDMKVFGLRVVIRVRFVSKILQSMGKRQAKSGKVFRADHFLSASLGQDAESYECCAFVLEYGCANVLMAYL